MVKWFRFSKRRKKNLTDKKGQWWIWYIKGNRDNFACCHLKSNWLHLMGSMGNDFSCDACELNSFTFVVLPYMHYIADCFDWQLCWVIHHHCSSSQIDSHYWNSLPANFLFKRFRCSFFFRFHSCCAAVDFPEFNSMNPRNWLVLSKFYGRTEFSLCHFSWLLWKCPPTSILICRRPLSEILNS